MLPRSRKARLQGRLGDWKAQARARQPQRDCYLCWGKKKTRRNQSLSFGINSRRQEKDHCLFYAEGNDAQGDRNDFSSAVAELGNDRHLLQPLKSSTPSTLCSASIIPLVRSSSRLLHSAEGEHEQPWARGEAGRARPGRQRGEGGDGGQEESFRSRAWSSHPCHAGRKRCHTHLITPLSGSGRN